MSKLNNKKNRMRKIRIVFLMGKMIIRNYWGKRRLICVVISLSGYWPYLLLVILSANIVVKKDVKDALFHIQAKLQ